jgi:hypothetical protein
MIQRILLTTLCAVPLFVIVNQGMTKEKRSSLVVAGGGHRCDRWLGERAQENSIIGFALEEWVLGFTLGIKTGTESDPPIESPTYLTGVTEDDLLTRMDNYCRAHRRDFIIQAALVVNADLKEEHANLILRSLERK